MNVLLVRPPDPMQGSALLSHTRPMNLAYLAAWLRRGGARGLLLLAGMLAVAFWWHPREYFQRESAFRLTGNATRRLTTTGACDHSTAAPCERAS